MRQTEENAQNKTTAKDKKIDFFFLGQDFIEELPLIKRRPLHEFFKKELNAGSGNKKANNG